MKVKTAIIIIVVFFLVVFLIFLLGSSKKSDNDMFEDEKKNTEEKEETTVQEEPKKEKSSCGDGTCDIGEDQWTCCQDCPCNQQGMECDSEKMQCVIKVTSKLSDAEAKDTFKKHILSEGIIDENSEGISYTVSEVPVDGKRVCYNLAGTVVRGGCAIVYDNNSVSYVIQYM